ncbi:MAG: hypothetical protein V2A63_01275 [Patescibacteria group bacterium]
MPTEETLASPLDMDILITSIGQIPEKIAGFPDYQKLGSAHYQEILAALVEETPIAQAVVREKALSAMNGFNKFLGQPEDTGDSQLCLSYPGITSQLSSRAQGVFQKLLAAERKQVNVTDLRVKPKNVKGVIGEILIAIEEAGYDSQNSLFQHGGKGQAYWRYSLSLKPNPEVVSADMTVDSDANEAVTATKVADGPLEISLADSENPAAHLIHKIRTRLGDVSRIDPSLLGPGSAEALKAAIEIARKNGEIELKRLARKAMHELLQLVEGSPALPEDQVIFRDGIFSFRGKDIGLKPKEAAIFEKLLNAESQPVSRDALIGPKPDYNTKQDLANTLTKIRKKLGRVGIDGSRSLKCVNTNSGALTGSYAFNIVLNKI